MTHQPANVDSGADAATSALRKASPAVVGATGPGNRPGNLICARPGCGKPVIQKGYGRPRKYCSHRCQNMFALRKSRGSASARREQEERERKIANWERQADWFEGLRPCYYEHTGPDGNNPPCDDGCMPPLPGQFSDDYAVELRKRAAALRLWGRPCHPLCDRSGSIRQCHDIPEFGHLERCDRNGSNRDCCTDPIPGHEMDAWDEEKRSWTSMTMIER
jgi:endogenous inhibitor of DNA gyrase (YacG/DUF329 family)